MPKLPTKHQNVRTEQVAGIFDLRKKQLKDQLESLEKGEKVKKAKKNA
jgi:predicted ArsR family transcriptional regulator